MSQASRHCEWATPWPLADPFVEPFTRRSLVVPTAWYRSRPQTLKADLFREDVRLLHKIMETAYAGWDTAKKRGWNWDAFFQDWEKSLAAHGSDALSLDDAYARMTSDVADGLKASAAK